MKIKLQDYVLRTAKGMNKGRNVILTDRISLINSRLRKMNILKGIDVADTEPRLIRDIAEEILRAYNASGMTCSDGSDELEIMSTRAECYVLEKVLGQAQDSGRIRTVRKESVSIPTVRDILACIRELRMNETTPEWVSSQDAKVSDIKAIIEGFENYLTENKEYDEVRLIREAIDILDRMPETTSGGLKISVDFLLPWIKDCNIGIPADCKLSKLEREFADKLISSFGVSFTEIETVGAGIADSDHRIPFSDSLKGHMYQAYGVANEVRQVIKSIKDAGEDIPYGDIQVFYSNPSYINYLKASFDSERIPYVLTNGYSAEELNLTQFMLTLIAFAADDFSYAILKDAMINPVITFKNVTEEKSDTVFINPIQAYNDVLNEGIGWGRKRYDRFRQKAHEEYGRYLNPDPNDGDHAKPKPDEKDYEDRLKRWERSKAKALNARYFADFTKELTECFDDELRTGEMLRKLWDFCGRYSFRQCLDRKKLATAIYEAIDDYRYLDEKSLNLKLEDKLAMLDECLRSTKVTEESDPAAVSVSMIQGIQIIERSNVFIIGLSAGKFELDTKQSPILLDDEKKKYISGAGSEDSPVVLSGAKNKNRRDELYKTISTLEAGDITFIYNKYDTTGLKDSSPSVFFMEVADMLGIAADEVPDACGYSPADSDIKIDAAGLRQMLNEEYAKLERIKEKKKEENEAKKKRNEELKSIDPDYDENSEENVDDAGDDTGDPGMKHEDDKPGEGSSLIKPISMSSTGMQAFLHCPLKYYYQYIKYLRVFDQKEKTGYMWLGNFSKGNLVHYTAEKYFSEYMPRKAGYTVPKIDKDALRRIVREQAALIEEVEPFMSPVIRDREEEEYYGKILEYFTYVIDNWCKEHPWVVIACELGFGDKPDCLIKAVEYTGKSADHPVNLVLNGSIDRVDGYLETADSGEKILHIRILDYKTGKQKSKQEEVEAEEQVQHFLYAIAAIEYLKKYEDKLKEIFCTDSIDRYAIDLIGYEHPFDPNKSTAPYTYDTTSVVSEVEGNVLSGKPGELKVDFSEDNLEELDDILGRYQRNDIEKLHQACIDHIVKRIEDERKKKPDKPYGMKNFCNYCDYNDVCRIHVGGDEDDLCKLFPGYDEFYN